MPPQAVPLPRVSSAAVRQHRAGSSSSLLKFAVYTVLALWVFAWFQPQWLLSQYGIRALVRVPGVLVLALGGLLGLGVLNGWDAIRRWTPFLPLFAFLASSALTVPFALNSTVAYELVKGLAVNWFIITA